MATLLGNVEGIRYPGLPSRVALPHHAHFLTKEIVLCNLRETSLPANACLLRLSTSLVQASVGRFGILEGRVGQALGWIKEPHLYIVTCFVSIAPIGSSTFW